MNFQHYISLKPFSTLWHTDTMYGHGLPITHSKNTQPFKDKAYLFYGRTQHIPRCKNSPLQLYKTNPLMFYKAKIAVCSEIRTEHINTM
jgi:hypothetical protein